MQGRLVTGFLVPEVGNRRIKVMVLTGIIFVRSLNMVIDSNVLLGCAI